jgi:F-type H+-transporting ATPase subunit b
MPQLDPSVFPPQLFWLILTFVPLYLILWRVVLPRMSGMLEARQHKIDNDLTRAAALRDEAEAVLAECEKTMADAHAEAHAMLRQVEEETAAKAEEEVEKVNQRLAKETSDAEASIEKAKQEAYENLKSVVSELAASATEKVVGAKLGEGKAADQAVEDAMKEQR